MDGRRRPRAASSRDPGAASGRQTAQLPLRARVTALSSASLAAFWSAHTPASPRRGCGAPSRARPPAAPTTAAWPACRRAGRPRPGCSPGRGRSSPALREAGQPGAVERQVAGLALPGDLVVGLQPEAHEARHRLVLGRLLARRGPPARGRRRWCSAARRGSRRSRAAWTPPHRPCPRGGSRFQLAEGAAITAHSPLAKRCSASDCWLNTCR